VLVEAIYWEKCSIAINNMRFFFLLLTLVAISLAAHHGVKKHGKHDKGMDPEHAKVMECLKECKECMNDLKDPEEDDDAMVCYKDHLECMKDSNFAVMPQRHQMTMKRMDHGMQMSACINKMFLCRNKADSDAGVCCDEFMDCKKAITAKRAKLHDDHKHHPLAKKGVELEKCLATFEKQRGTVSDEVCINDFSNCIIKAEMPKVPGSMLKHGHCLRNLKSCSPANAEDAEICMKDYHGCLGAMMHMTNDDYKDRITSMTNLKHASEKMEPNHMEAMECLVEEKECMNELEDPDHDDDTMECYHDHLKCMKNLNFAVMPMRHQMTKKHMSHGMQMSACINKLFVCRSKADSDAGVCCDEFMDCKKAITIKREKTPDDHTKHHPLVKKGLALEKCLATFEKQHGTVSDEVCINDFSNCIVEVDMPKVPGPMLRHGHCLRNLETCSPSTPEDAKPCMDDYHDCLGSMLHKAMERDDDDDHRGMKMGSDHKEVMECLVDCKECMNELSDPDEDDDAMACYSKHLKCMKDFDFGKTFRWMSKRGQMQKMFPKMGQFKKCFGELETCASKANDKQVINCAVEMKSCMAKGEGKKPDYLMRLPDHIKNTIRNYLKCSEGGGKMPQCIRNHISSVKRMSYGFQISSCINKIFFCQSKEEPNAGVCCNDFMSCQKAITAEKPNAMTVTEKEHPMAKKGLAMEECLATFEKEHGTVSDEVCINNFSKCIINVELKMVPTPMLKHGYCLRKLKECSPADADDATNCMSDYHGCLGSMMHKVNKTKDEDQDDDDL